MARTTTITDKQILEAARAIFLEEGFSAQTAKIARQAGVSEGSIFKRFPTKEALFFAALEIELSPAWHAHADKLTAEWQGQEGLVSLFVDILHYFSDMLPRMITTVGSHVSMLSKQPFKGLPESPPARDRRKLSDFFRQAIEAGHLRQCNADVIAHLLLGTAIEFMFNIMFETRSTLDNQQPNNQQPTQEELMALARGAVDIIWSGIAPR